MSKDLIINKQEFRARDVIAYSFNFIVSNFGTLLKVSIIPIIIYVLVTIFCSNNEIVFYILSTISSFAIYLFLIIASHLLLNNIKPELNTVFKVSISRIIPLIILSILAYLMIGIGLVLLIIPSVIIIIYLSLVHQFCIIEKQGPIESIKSSFAYIKNRWWKTFRLTILISLICTAINIPFVALVGMVAFFLNATDNATLILPTSNLISVPIIILLNIINAVVRVVYYNNVKFNGKIPNKK